MKDERGLKIRVAVALSGMGFGLTIAFFFTSLFLPSYAGLERALPYFLLGLWGGAFVFSMMRPRLFVSGVAYVCGLGATVAAGMILGRWDAGLYITLMIFGLTAIIPYFCRAEGFMDVLLAPSGYFGGFLTGLIMVADVASSGVSYMILSGILGAFICFFAVIFKFFAKEAARRLKVRF
ncbi:MAG: hypothetical protein GXO14_02615 [Thermococci archaeon]|nr:hypothetical protein [Thermococci archaeon]